MDIHLLLKNTSKIVGKNFSGKTNHKIFYHAAAKVATDAFKTVLKGSFQKTEQVTGDLSGNEIACKIRRTASRSALKALHKQIKIH